MLLQIHHRFQRCVVSHGGRTIPRISRDHARCIRTSLTIFLALLITPTPSHGAPPTATEALSLSPVQKDVIHDQIALSEQNQCSVGEIKTEGWSGWEVNAPDGTVLRRFADTNDDQKVDIWSYFRMGIEVYRDIDQDFNGKADQYRWLGTNGMRWGLDDNEDGVIDNWKRISAEEVTAELIRAIRDQNFKAFDCLLASEEELRQSGIGPENYSKIIAKTAAAREGFVLFSESQTQVDSGSEWLQFAANRPGLVPSGTDGSLRDLVVYENAVAMFQSAGQTSQISVGTLIRIDQSWRLIGLPTFPDEQTNPISSGVFFEPATPNMISDSAIAMSDVTQQLIQELENIDQQLAGNASRDELPQLNARRADLLEKFIASANQPNERNSWTLQLIDMLSIAAQTGDYPEAMSRLDALTNQLEDEKSPLIAQAKYQSITTNYLVAQVAGADFGTVQKQYIESLDRFVQDFPDAPESAAALMQLALNQEFEGEAQNAITLYQRVGAQFPKSSSVQTANGAVRRLESEGKMLDLQGTTLAGESFQLSNLRGKVVILHYWATWCNPCLQDMKGLAQLKKTYRGANLEFVGINVDIDIQKPREKVRQMATNWPQLFEEGGLEGSNLSQALGIQTLPAMLLIDPSGRVLRNDLRFSELEVELSRLFKRKN